MNRAQRRANPTSWASTIAASRTMAPALAVEIMTKLHSAFHDLRNGSIDDELFERVAASINVGIVRAEQIDELCVAPMLAMRDALIRCDEIRGRHGRYGFDGSGLQAMADGLDVYEEMVRKSTPNQMRAAMSISMQRQVAAENAQEQPPWN